MEERKLQPLRIISGWHVEWNLFYEVDPAENTMTYFDSSSLLHLNNEHAKRAINLDWSPESDINGYYNLRVINLIKVVDSKTKKIRYEGDWENLHYEFKSRNRLEVVAEIERLLVQLPPFVE